MAPLTTDQTFDLAVGHHQAGRLADAEKLYRQILADEPDHIDAIHFLGMAALQAGRNDEAMKLLRQAIALDPEYPEAHNNLGSALKTAGNFDEALAEFRKAIALDPALPEAHSNLGIALAEHQQYDDAIASFRQAIVHRSDYAEAYSNLGLALKDKGQLDDAIAAQQKAISLNPNLSEAHCNLGIALKQKGLLDEAIASFRKSAALKPALAEAHNNLGIALAEKKDFDAAIASYRQAIALRSGYAEACNNLAVALMETGRLDEAVEAFGKTAELKPDYAEAYNNLGVVLKTQKQLDKAIAAFRKSVSINPKRAEVLNNLGTALKDNWQLDDAVAAFRQAISAKPDYAEAFSNLGNALGNQAKLDEAIAAYRKSIEINPNLAQTYSNLGNALADCHQMTEAIAAYRKAIALKPSYAQAYSNLGNAFRSTSQLNDAAEAFHKAISLDPNLADAHSNLGNVMLDKGDLDETLASYRRAMELQPDDPHTPGKLIFAMHYHPGSDARAIADELARWNHQHAEPLRKFIQPYANDRNPDRRLRIGFVSPDFREHVVAFILLPLILEMDRSQFEITCYAQVIRPDETTAKFEKTADRWRNIVGMSDEQVASQIRQDQIDVLVDLTLHTGHNRLLVFARKPAPVQVSYLGYCGSSGLTTMDYRLSDPYVDPPGSDLSCYSEKTVHLPRTYWCYKPNDNTPDVAPLPALKNGFVSFGCLNTFAKISPDAFELWGRILAAVPESRMYIHAPPGDHLEEVARRFEAAGVSTSRLIFVLKQRWQDYMQTYSHIDISLDPFPYAGGVTTCDGLWMGVPVVTLEGQTAVGRGGKSLLTNLGLSELIAQSPEQYEQIATSLARDLPRLDALRRGMRDRMLASPLMNIPAFARDIEAAYRRMWRTWCETAPAK